MVVGFIMPYMNLKITQDLELNEILAELYELLIGKNSGPRAGWFLSILPRDWLIKRLKIGGIVYAKSNICSRMFLGSTVLF